MRVLIVIFYIIIWIVKNGVRVDNGGFVSISDFQ